jgi:SpoVK/Ycf46/Vps4 family AAA+-type ATPase
LTRYEAEGAYALSLVRQGHLAPDTIWELKAQALKQSGLVRLHAGKESFADLGGLAALKDFCRRALVPGRHSPSGPKPRGILLLGVPGTGKSAFAKALGTETGRPTLLLDMGALYGSLVGQTEQNVRQALKIAEAMAPCILFVDEIEKGLGGAVGAGAGDSGVSSRLLGTLLSWLSDHQSDVFVVCTANNVAQLPPEFTRAERFDAIYFLDLPDTAHRQAIWVLHQQEYSLGQQARPSDHGWTGAEIRSCCRLAALLNISLVEAAQYVVPISVTAADTVEQLRTWADGRCLSADRPGIYRRKPPGASRSARKISPNPSQN